MSAARGSDDTSWDPRAPAVVAWIERSVGQGARVAGTRVLARSSTAMHLVDVVLEDGSAQRLVLRRYDDADRLGVDPWYVPAHEASTLELLGATPIPAPRLYGVDLAPAVCDVPALLESWVPGEAAWHPDDLEGYIVRAAAVLVVVHAVAVSPARDMLAYAPYYDLASIVPPLGSTRPGLWERVATALDVPWPAHAASFVHRDFHPGNVLWDGTRISGVVDWATAAVGPPGIDLARMRQNLAAHFGRWAADRFLTAYVAAGGDASARHPFWDLLDAADTLPDLKGPVGPGEGDLARFEDYVARVLAECEAASG